MSHGPALEVTQSVSLVRGNAVEPRSLHAVRPRTAARCEAHGKFLFVGDEKLYVRGVTYGPFRPDAEGEVYPDPNGVAEDFARIAAAGANAVRLYTVPPRWLLDLAAEHGLRLMVGLAWDVQSVPSRIYAEASAGAAAPRPYVMIGRGFSPAAVAPDREPDGLVPDPRVREQAAHRSAPA